MRVSQVPSSHLSRSAKSESSQRPVCYQPVQWGVWIALLLLPGGFAWWGAHILLQPTELAECRSISWSDHTDLMRLYCAQITASQQTVKNLQEAIALVDVLPEDHPSREQADRLIAYWSKQLLRLGETTFQEGQLDEAIAIAERVPLDSSVRGEAKQKIKQWRTIWANAEEIYQSVESAVRSEDWLSALDEARKLLYVGNQYWATTQHQQLMQELMSHQEVAAVSQKRQLQKMTTQSTPNSLSDNLLAQWERQREQEDQTRLNRAQQLARSGKVEDLQMAITEANKVLFGTKYYEQAQKWIDDWDRQIDTAEDRSRLSQADGIAQKDDVTSLQSAINEIRWITSDRPLYDEAQSRINQWSNRILSLQTPEPPPEVESTPTSPEASPSEPRLAPVGRVLRLEEQIIQQNANPPGIEPSIPSPTDNPPVTAPVVPESVRSNPQE